MRESHLSLSENASVSTVDGELKFQNFFELIEANYTLMQFNKLLILNDRKGLLVENISPETIEDKDTLAVLPKLVQANRLMITFDSQEPIIQPRVGHYGTVQVRKQYVTALTTLTIVNALRDKVAELNKLYDKPVLYLTGYPLFHKQTNRNPIEEPPDFLKKDSDELPLTFHFGSNGTFEISAAASAVVRDGEKGLISDFEQKFKSWEKDLIVMFSIYNIQLIPQVDIWDFIICVENLIFEPEKQKEIWDKFTSNLAVKSGLYRTKRKRQSPRRSKKKSKSKSKRRYRSKRRSQKNKKKHTVQ